MALDEGRAAGQASLRAQQQSDYPRAEPPESGAQIDALRFWLASGIHRFAVDPRRRLGSHGRARKVLAEDPRTGPAPAGAWQSLASTLDRHTVRGGMTELSPEELRVIMLAYLEGRTNREIANVLGVSPGTVKRRLKAALKRLDDYLTRTGTWLSAMLLLGTGYVVATAIRLGRPAKFVRSTEWTQLLGSTAAVGVIAAVAIGSTAISPGSASPGRSSTPEPVQAIAAPPGGGANLSPGQRPTVAPAPKATRVVVSDPSHGSGRNDDAIEHQKTGADHPNQGNGRKGSHGHPNGPPGHSPNQEDQGLKPNQGKQGLTAHAS